MICHARLLAINIYDLGAPLVYLANLLAAYLHLKFRNLLRQVHFPAQIYRFHHCVLHLKIVSAILALCHQYIRILATCTNIYQTGRYMILIFELLQGLNASSFWLNFLKFGIRGPNNPLLPPK